MHRRIFLFISLISLFCIDAYSQRKTGQERIDSLLTELPKAGEDTNKVKLLIAISKGYSATNFGEAIKYGEESVALSKKLNWQKGEMSGILTIGLNYFKTDFHKAIEQFEKCLQLSKVAKDAKVEALAYGYLGFSYFSLGNYVRASEYYQQELHITEITGDKSLAATVYGNMATLYFKQKLYDKAIDFANKSLELYTEKNDKNGMATVFGNMSSVYIEKGQYDTALNYLQKALEIQIALNNKGALVALMGNIGVLHKRQRNYEKAMECYTRALKLATEVGDKSAIAVNFDNIGCLYLAMAKDGSAKDGLTLISNTRPGNLHNAVSYLKKSVEMAKVLGAVEALANTYPSLSEAYKLSGKYKEALDAHEQYLLYKDSVFSKENMEKITRLEVEGQYKRKELADSLKNLEARKLSALKLQKQKTYTYIGAAGVFLLLGFSFFIAKERGRSEKARNQAEGLLLNILPSEVADELKERGATTAKHYDNVTVLFTDFVNFTGAGERMGTQRLVEELHTCFKAFDEIISKYNIEKIKTIGDAYLAVSGLPVPDSRHAENIMKAAIEIQTFMHNRRQQPGSDTFEVRIGIHSGPVVAGIVGVKKFAYDIWGDTVNTAARMEQKSEAGKINISQTTYDLVKDKFNCTYRGEIEAKNKGMPKMYFVTEMV